MLLVVIPVSTEAPRGGVAQGGTRLRDVSPAAVAPRGARGAWRDAAHGPLVTVISHRLDPCHSQLQKSPGKALAFGRVCHLAICLHSVLLHSIRINKLREEKATNAA